MKRIPVSRGKSISDTLPPSIADMLFSFSTSVFISSIIGHIISVYLLGNGNPTFLAEIKPKKTTTFKDVYGLEKPKEILQ